MSERHLTKAELALRTTAASVLLALGGYGLAGCAPVVSAEPSPTPTSISGETNTPNPDAEQAEFEQKVEALRIPEGLSDEALATTILERQESWANAGKRDSIPADLAKLNFDQFKNDQHQSTMDEYLLDIAKEEGRAYAAALLPEGWENDPALVDFVNSSINYNFIVLKAYSVTAWNGDEVPENKEGFKTDFILDGVAPTEAPEGERGLNIDFTEDWNDENNTADPIETPWHRIATTSEVVDGHEVLTSAVVTVRYSN